MTCWSNNPCGFIIPDGRKSAGRTFASWRETVSREEQAFQELFAARLQQLL